MGLHKKGSIGKEFMFVIIISLHGSLAFLLGDAKDGLVSVENTSIGDYRMK